MNTVMQTQWVTCGYCGATSLNAPPHGQGQPCPMKVATEAAYVEMLEAQTASHLRSGMTHIDLGKMLRREMGEEDGE